MDLPHWVSREGIWTMSGIEGECNGVALAAGTTVNGLDSG